ncbi:hypothetical protein EW145_g2094 [Phellinidium pouzarii]|uniref:VASt domain-containing protein n=1 Tax=Phellinidium pouzarii TaxID=167371 RepID=A0A4S4LC40_9AGAM|nr:hypothetical protein EW145_g2094 [Phellinidium pouzarii]
MAPNFLSKFVKTNTALSPENNHTRSRTSSDIGPLRARTVSDALSITPSLVLTRDNGDSPVQPTTPGSLHRSDSPRSKRSRSASPAVSVRSRPSPVTTPRREAQALLDMQCTTSPENVMRANDTMGLGIDLGQPRSNLPSDTSSSNGDMLKHKHSSKSLKSVRSAKIDGEVPPMSSASQVVELPPRSQSMFVESPTSDSTPTVAAFPSPSEIDAASGSSMAPSMSTTSQNSLQPRLPDSDSISISSAVSSNKKMTWRRGSVGSSKKRKPTGLASAIAASGLVMANPVVTHSLTQFVPPPSLPSSPPRNYGPPQSPTARSFSGGDRHPPSSSSRVRSPGDSSSISMGDVAEANESTNGDQFYSDVSSGSEDELDLQEEIPVTGFAVASNRRNADFHEMFPQVPEGDYLIEDYGCALQREILIQGRLYISENHICFHANIFGWITDLIIPVYEIISVEKKMTALFIPNAIQITTRTSKYTFASFLSRDTTYDVVHNIWKLSRPDAESIRSGGASARPSLDDPRLYQENNVPEEKAQKLENKVTVCKCGKEDLHYSETAMVAVFPGTPEKIYNLIYHSDLQISDWIPDPESNLLSRKFSYIKILNGVVKQTKCELKDETVYCDFSDHVSTVTTTRTPDVPSGNAFAVKTRTCITWASSATTKVVVTTQVEWTGRSFIKSMISSSAIEGQKQYHIALDRAIRKYIAEHKNEFIPEGMEEVIEAPITVEETTNKEIGVSSPNAQLSEEDANKRREHERNQRATQWAFDTCMGAWKVAKQSTLDALDLVGDAWDQSSSTTVLYFIIVVLVFSNIWTLVMVGRREEVGRRKSMIKVEEQQKWVANIVSALWDERQTMHHPTGEPIFSVPALRDGCQQGEVQGEVGEINRVLDLVEQRVTHLRQSLRELD